MCRSTRKRRGDCANAPMHELDGAQVDGARRHLCAEPRESSPPYLVVWEACRQSTLCVLRTFS